MTTDSRSISRMSVPRSSLDQHGRQVRRRPPDNESKGEKRAPQEIQRSDEAALTELHDELLKAFDLNYSFGPSYGISRLERWERAKHLGLNPPDTVKQLLQQHSAEPRYTESLWNQTGL